MRPIPHHIAWSSSGFLIELEPILRKLAALRRPTKWFRLGPEPCLDEFYEPEFSQITPIRSLEDAADWCHDRAEVQAESIQFAETTHTTLYESSLTAIGSKRQLPRFVETGLTIYDASFIQLHTNSQQVHDALASHETELQIP